MRKDRRCNAKPILEELEARQLFSAGIEGVLLHQQEPESALYQDIGANDTISQTTADNSHKSAFIDTPTQNFQTNLNDEAPVNINAPNFSTLPVLKTSTSKELIFVDTTVKDYQQLLAGISPDAQIILLDPNQDGVTQISQALAQQQDLNAIHILSHGSDGAINIGNSQLNLESLTQNQQAISKWGNAFTANGDILIYGCNVAETQFGQSFVDYLSGLTRTDVSASNDTTGNSALGGDWTLEYQTGAIETKATLSSTVQNQWNDLLAITSNGTITSASSINTTNLTWSHTVNTGSNSALFVEVAIDGLGANVSGVTYGGVALTQVGRETGNHAVEIWALVNPIVGTGNVVVNYTGNTAAAAGASTFNGVNQSTPTGTFVGNSGTTFLLNLSGSVTVPSAPGEVVVDVQFWTDTQADPVGSGQTSQWSSSSFLTSALGSSSTEVGAASVTMSGDASILSVLGAQWSIGAVSIKAAATNAAPTATNLSAAETYTEDTSLNLTDIVVNDVDSPNVTATLTLSDSAAGSLNTGTSGTVTSTYTSSTGVWSASGVAADVNTLLAGLTFMPAANFNSTFTIATSVSDGVAAAITGNKTMTGNAVTDAPVNTVPGVQSTNQDTNLVFSSGNGNQISISDIDVGSASIEVTLSITNGTLTLAGLTNLTFKAGNGSANATMTFQGTVSAINAALDGLSYSPTPGYTGSATLTLATKDSVLLSLDIDTSLKGRYTFESLGALGTDTSPAANNGTVNGATALNDATRGNVLSLAGNAYIQTPSFFGSPTNVTLSAWVNLNTANANGADVISLGDNVLLRLDGSGGLIGGFYNGSTWIGTTYNTTLAGTGWHHVAFSFDDAGNKTALYLDGTLVSSVTTTDSIHYTLGIDSFIGRHGNGNTTFDFNGKIDDARIYNRVLSASEVAALANDISITPTNTTPITVLAVNAAPVINSNGGGTNASISLAENTITVTTVTSSDVDGGVPVYSLLSGADSAKFTINPSTGALSFNSAPDYETPADSDSNNIYTVSVQVSDGNGGTDTQNIAVTVTDVSNALVVTTATDNNDSGILTGAAYSAEWLNAHNGADAAISLREAIIATNNTGGTDTITFNIGGAGIHTIAPTSVLPTITDAVVIDGYSQTGASENTQAVGSNAVLLIELNGANAGSALQTHGLNITAGNTTIRGLVINNFAYAGIMLDKGGDSNVIQGNYIGTDASGMIAKPNGNGTDWDGIVLGDEGSSSNNLIGGSTPADRNVISGNMGGGIWVTASTGGNIIQGNYIGVNSSGTTALGNVQHGIILQGTGNLISHNVISGNGSVYYYGIYLPSYSDHTVIQGNLIGVGADGVTAIDNNNHGIYIDAANNVNNTIGGISNGEGNIIANNTGKGIVITNNSSGNAILGNSLVGNFGLGIDLDDNGVTANDSGDGDTGSNNLQNFPLLTNATVNGPQITLGGILNSTTNSNFRIEFFASSSQDTTGYGEGQRYLGYTNVITDSSGTASINTTLTATVSVGEYVSATATRSNSTYTSFTDTSEFSLNMAAAVVNILPVNTVPATLTFNEDSTTAISGLSITDPDAGTSTLRTELTVSSGILSANSGGAVSVTGSGTSTLVLTGTLVDLNNYLASAAKPTYTGATNSSGAVTLTMVTSDGLNTGIGGSVAAGIFDYRFQDGAPAGSNPNLIPVSGGVTGVATDLSAPSLANTLTGSNTTFGVIYSGILNVTTAGTYTFTVAADDAATLFVDGTQVLLAWFGSSSNSATLTAGQHSIELHYAQDTGGAGLSASYSGPDTTSATTPLLSAPNVGRLVSQTASTAITVTAVNDAPVLSTGLAFLNITEDAFNNNGMLVADYANLATDVDAGAMHGIAVTAVDNSHGIWEYTLDATNWLAIGNVSTTNALLLAGDTTTRFRFVPDADWNGVTGMFNFKAWDLTSGTAGTFVDVSVNGGTTSFSFGINGNTLVVAPVNDTPIITPSGSTPSYTENGAAVVLDANVVVYDVDQAAIGNYAGSTLTLSRNGGTNSQDTFSSSGLLSAIAEGNSLIYNGTALGSVTTNSNGTLVFTFNSSATPALVNATIQAIAYSNNSEAPPASVQINWIINDHNSGAQGSGGPASGNGSSTVNMTSVNDAPVLSPVAPTLTTITEDNITNPGQTVASFLGGSITDVDSGALQGIAITGVSSGTVGYWEYSVDGGSNWTWVGLVSNSSARLLGGNDLIRYHPDQAQAETVSFTYRAWDQSTGTAGNLINTAANGGSTAFSSAIDTASLAVTNINDAPVAIPQGYSLTSITEDQTTNSGGTVKSFISHGSMIVINAYQDYDPADNMGIALTATNDGNGHWEYSLNNGTLWNTVGPVSDASALLLRETDLVRFIPDSFNSTTASLSYRFWDQTSGITGTNVDTTGNGGTTSFSSGTDSSSITVTPVNDAPNLSSTYTFTAIAEDDTGNLGTLVSSILSGGISDPDTGALQAIAVVNVDNSNGTWQYTLDGTNWFAMGNASLSTARLLPADATTSVRFLPNADFNGLVSPFSYKAWDQSTGAAGGTADASSAGGTTAFSSGTSGTSLSVSAINDAPLITTSGTVLIYTENAAATKVDSALTVTDIDSTHLSSATVSISAGFASGQDILAFHAHDSAITGSWNASTGVLTLSGSATVSEYQTALRSITYLNSSNNPSTATRTLSFFVSDSSTSSVIATRSININPVNDMPVINSNGGAATASISLAENTNAVTTVIATDVDNGLLSFGLIGGNDQAKFNIDPNTGVLSFINAPDFENKLDVNSDNIYEVIMQVDDGNGGIDTQAISVSITNLTESASLSLNPISNSNIPENSAFTGVTPVLNGTPVGSVTYTLGGNDAGAFSVDDSTGVVSMVARDYEAPSDFDGNNVYDIILIATDQDTNTASTSFSITVSNLFESATISLNPIANASIPENTAFTGVTPVLNGTPVGNVTYTLGGNDAGAFSVDACTGVVSMVARDYEAPSDFDGNNVYELILIATDSDSNTAHISFSVTISNLVESATISLNPITNASIPENTAFTSISPTLNGTPVGSVTYTLGGNDAGAFSVNANTGVISMVARDYEAPADNNHDNVYNLTLSASDQDGNTTNTSFSVNVTNLSESIALSLNPISNSNVLENHSFISAAPVLNGIPVGNVTYTISGADVSKFTVNPSTGVVSMAAQHFDADGDNLYGITLTATDQDGNSASSSFSVTVTKLVEATILSLNPIGNSSIPENRTFTSNTPVLNGTPVGNVTYTINGADAALFSVNPATGVVSLSNQNYEMPQDANRDNVYKVTLTATDQNSHSASTGFSITVTNIVETPINQPSSGHPVIIGSATEDQTLKVDCSAVIDSDGLGVFSIQWLRNNVIISGANGTTYTLGDADVGQRISVNVNYSDGAGNPESLSSVTTAPVTNINDIPSGTVSINGTASQGQILTASNTLKDADGLGAISYQWQRDGVDIPGANSSRYELSESDVGSVIRVVASYTDTQGTAESKSSNNTSTVTGNLTVPVSTPAIIGTMQVDQILNINTLGITSIENIHITGYQWFRNGVAITDATNSSYVLSDQDIGSKISVQVFYTDMAGILKNIMSHSRLFEVSDTLINTPTKDNVTNHNNVTIVDNIQTTHVPQTTIIQPTVIYDNSNNSLLTINQFTQTQTQINTPQVSTNTGLAEQSSTRESTTALPLKNNFSSLDKFFSSIVNTNSVVESALTFTEQAPTTRHYLKDIIDNDAAALKKPPLTAFKEAPQNISLSQVAANQANDFSVDLETLFTATEEQALWQKLASMRQTIEQTQTEQTTENMEIMICSTVTLTAGFVSWILRGGALLASFLPSIRPGSKTAIFG